MRRGCRHTASARAGSGASAIRDPGASVGDSARLALEVRGPPFVTRIQLRRRSLSGTALAAPPPNTRSATYRFNPFDLTKV
jgi:hypothetical protein